MTEIPYRQYGCQDLPQNSSNGGAHHAPSEGKNKHWVQSDVDCGAGKGGCHSELGAAVRADDGIHGLSEHIERNTQRNPEEIRLCLSKGLRIDPAAEGGEDGLLENQVYDGQNQAADHAQHHGVSNTPVGVFLIAGTQADTDKGTATVADHDGHGQSYYGQRNTTPLAALP